MGPMLILNFGSISFDSVLFFTGYIFLTNGVRSELVVAGVPEHFNLPWHLALEAQQFQAAGLDVTYRDYPGGTGAMTRALARNEVDLAILLAEGAVADIVKRKATRLVKVYVESPLIWGIHVSDASAIHQVDQIRDRRYAISRKGSGSHLMAIVDAAERGWETDDIEFEIVRNLDGARKALARDDADIFLWEKFTTQPLVDSGEFRRVGLRETLWPAFVVAVNESVLQTRTDEVRTLLEVINTSCQTLMDAKDAVSLVADRYALQQEDVQQWFACTRWSTDFQRPNAALETIVRYLYRLELIDTQQVTPEDLWFSL